MKTLSSTAERWLNSLYDFGLEAWGLDLEEQPHRWMCDEFEKTLSLSDTPYLMLDVPRGTYKCQSKEEYEELSGRLCAVKNGHAIEAACPTAVEDGPVVDLFRVTTSSGRSIDVSSNHPFMTWPNVWWSLDDGLKVGEWIAVVRKGIFGARHEPSLARLVGWMLADAHLKSQTVTVFDKAERDDLAALIAECGYTYAEMTNDDGLRVHGMQDLWRGLGLFHSKSKDKFTPEFVLQGDEETVRAFLAGLSKDAYVSKGRNLVVYVTTSRRLARDYQHLLTKFGIHSNLCTIVDEDGSYTGIEGYLHYRVIFTDTAGLLGPPMELRGPSPTDLFPPQWRKRIPSGMNLRRFGIRIDNDYATSRSKLRRVAEAMNDTELLRMCDGDIAWQQIKSIEPLGKGQIIHVESPTGTLATCDIVSHNTSLVTCGAVWQYLRQVYFHDNPYHRIVYASNTLALGEAFLTLIENILRVGGKDGALTEAYGPLWKTPDRINRKSSRQNDGLVLAPRMERGEIAAVRDPNFFICSIGALPIGKHADGGIIDDLNNAKNVSTTDQLKKTHNFYRQVYPIIHTVDRIGNPAHIWFCATPWKDDDVRGMIMREEEERKLENPEYVSPWRIVKATAHMDDGSLFFPTKLSEKELSRLKKGMGSEYYAAYEGSPVTKESSIATKDQIRYKTRDEFPALSFCRMFLDPNQHSDAKVLGCYAALVMGGYDCYGKLWIWDARGGRDWDTGKTIAELYRAQEEHPNWPIFVEDEHMRHFDHAVNLEFVNRMHRAEDGGPPPSRLKLNYVPAPRDLSKYARCEGALKPRFESASIFFAQEIPASIKDEIENEVTRGLAARFKDFLDALSGMETGVLPRYKSNGRAEIVHAGRPDPAAQTHRKPTFNDAFGVEFN